MSEINDDDNHNVVEWARRPGALAWATLPQSVVNQLTNTSHNNNNNNNSNSQSNNIHYYWPVILYPSWSYAATHSGLILQQQQKNQPTENQSNNHTSSHQKQNSLLCPPNQKINFIGCKTSITIDQMKRNMVPKRVALGCSSVKGQALRPKVVAYVLGLADTSSGSGDIEFEDCLGTYCSWCAVNVQEVRPYTMDNCYQILNEFSTIISSKNEKKQEKSMEIMWSYLMVAMEEASIVSEQEDFNPNFILKQIENKGDIKRMKDIIDNDKSIMISEDGDNSTSKLKRKNVGNENGPSRKRVNDDSNATEMTKSEDIDSGEALTPECFNDWRVSGNTQRNGESQSQFVLTAGSAL